MSKIVATIVGLTQLQGRVKGITTNARAGASDAINRVATEVHNESQRRVPVDIGNLKGSGRISPSQPSTLTATVGYGGTAAAYALIVHETHRTQAKFLEEPANAATKRLTDEVAAAVKAAER